MHKYTTKRYNLTNRKIYLWENLKISYVLTIKICFQINKFHLFTFVHSPLLNLHDVKQDSTGKLKMEHITKNLKEKQNDYQLIHTTELPKICLSKHLAKKQTRYKSPIIIKNKIKT